MKKYVVELTFSEARAVAQGLRLRLKENEWDSLQARDRTRAEEAIDDREAATAALEKIERIVDSDGVTL